MKAIIGSQLQPLFSTILMLRIVRGNLCESVCTDVFLVRPGDGEEFVYSPINVNATIHCVVNHTNQLSWTTDGLSLDSESLRPALHSRGIFQSGITNSSGIIESIVTVLGNREVNNNIRICCLSVKNTEIEESCTTLILYDRPSTPTHLSVQYDGGDNLIKISWTATTIPGVNQTYIIAFKSNIIKTTELFYTYRDKRITSNVQCDIFLAYVKAVNGAGESDPSKNVSIPSLPDIEPVTASLTHQVWKQDGEIRMNVSFEPAGYCFEYPILSYLLVLRTGEDGVFINISVDANETRVTLGPQDGLEEDKKYLITATAVNSIGTATSHQDECSYTSDVQSVNATVIGESTIDIQCYFIPGSDALGCKVVLVSHCLNVSDDYATLSRSRNTSAYKRLTLTHSISCYLQVFAFDIDVNNIVGNLSIAGKIKLMTDVHGGDGQHSEVAIAIVLPALILFTAFMLMIVAISVVLWRRRQSSKASSTSRSGKSLPCECAESPSVQQAEKKYPQFSTYPESEDNCSESDKLSQPPLYAFPNKLKEKRSFELSEGVMESDQFESNCLPTEKSGDPEGVQNEEEHFYHVLEVSSNKSSCNKGIILPDPDAPELPSPLEPDSQDTDTPPVYHDINELSCKPNKVVDCDKNDQHCNQETNNSGTTALKESPHNGKKQTTLSLMEVKI